MSFQDLMLMFHTTSSGQSSFITAFTTKTARSLQNGLLIWTTYISDASGLLKWVAPPHTVGSLKHCLCSMENIDPKLTKLFASFPNQSALADEARISLMRNQTLGIIPEDPVILFSKATPRVEIQPGTERFRIAPDSKSPVAPRFLFYAVYAEAGAQASRDPVDAEEPWVSKIDLNSILYPVSVTSLSHILARKEGIHTSSSQLLAQDGDPLGDDQIFTKDGNWLGASAEDHVVLKLTGLPPFDNFSEGSQYKIQNRSTGKSLVSWSNDSDLDFFKIVSDETYDGPHKHFTLRRQDDGSVAFHHVKHEKWIGPNCHLSTTKHGFWLVPSTTEMDYFVICEGDIVSCKAFYDGTEGSPYDHLELREFDTTDSGQMWRLIAK